MIKKHLLFFVLIYFLILIQVSFLPHFCTSIFCSLFLNPILILICTINFFEKQKSPNAFLFLLFAGLFSELFSEKFFGLFILIFLSVAILIKFILKRYVQFF